MRNERQVAGLWCRDVIERLPDLLADALAPDQLAAVNAHLADCDVCERFGGEYAATVAALRRRLETAERLPPGFLDTLARRLEEAGPHRPEDAP